MARTDPQVNFRIPAALNEKLKEAAQSNNRTITAELVSRLEWSFENEEAGPPPGFDESMLEHFAILIAEKLKSGELTPERGGELISGNRRKKSTK